MPAIAEAITKTFGKHVTNAVLRTADRGNIKLMFPMVASVDEFRLARQVVEEECQRLHLPAVPVGAMIEIPAAALKSAQLAAVADFFSIGTNDLTQYTLAMDRGHPRLAPFLDALDPAVADQERGVIQFGVRIVYGGDAAGAVDEQRGHGLVLG